jgi:hypothetical protein
MDLSRHGLLALAMIAMTAQAQEATDAVDTLPSATPAALSAEPALNTDPTNELDAIGPAVPSSVLTADARSQGPAVIDEIYLSRAEITGNQELPKVLYIVPWKKSDPGELTGKPVNTLLDEVMAPLDRGEFLRQIDYYGDIYRNDEQETLN